MPRNCPRHRHAPPQNNLFDQVAKKNSDKWMNVSTGQEMLGFMAQLTTNNCCVKRLTFGGHGWNHSSEPNQKPYPPIQRGPGIPGASSGSSGSYEDGTAHDAGGATISDLKSRMDAGQVKFCRPCLIQIHSCRVSQSFITSLASTTGCRASRLTSIVCSGEQSARGQYAKIMGQAGRGHVSFPDPRLPVARVAWASRRCALAEGAQIPVVRRVRM